MSLGWGNGLLVDVVDIVGAPCFLRLITNIRDTRHGASACLESLLGQRWSFVLIVLCSTHQLMMTISVVQGAWQLLSCFDRSICFLKLSRFLLLLRRFCSFSFVLSLVFTFGFYFFCFYFIVVIRRSTPSTNSFLGLLFIHSALVPLLCFDQPLHADADMTCCSIVLFMTSDDDHINGSTVTSDMYHVQSEKVLRSFAANVEYSLMDVQWWMYGMKVRIECHLNPNAKPPD